MQDLTKLERVLMYWDKEDRILYAAAREHLRRGTDLGLLASESELDIDELQELVDELKEYESVIDSLNVVKP